MTTIVTDIEQKRNEKNTLKYYTYNHQGQLKFNHHLVKGEILAETPIFRSDIGILRYENGVFARSTSGDIKHIIQKRIGEEATISRKQEILDLILHENEAIPLSEFNKYDKILNLKNGVYDIRQRKVLPHSPHYFSTNQQPVIYNPEAKCPAILEFLHDILDEDLIQFVIEWIAYCCLPETTPDKIVILKGGGGEGKSTLLNIINHFLGHINIAHMSLHEIAEDKFMKAQLYGKMANICGDIDGKAINETGIIKNLTGGEPIQAQFKGIDSFTYQSYAKLMFSANNLPKSIDTSKGWDRRWFIVPFVKSVPEEKKMERSILDKRLTSPEELSGLLNLVIQAIHKLESNKYKFAIPEATKKALMEYKLSKDELAQFITLNCETNKKTKMKSTDFYYAFKDWLQDEHDQIADSKNKIKEQLSQKGFKTELGAGNNYWLMGLTFKENSNYYRR